MNLCPYCGGATKRITCGGPACQMSLTDARRATAEYREKMVAYRASPRNSRLLQSWWRSSAAEISHQKLAWRVEMQKSPTPIRDSLSAAIAALTAIRDRDRMARPLREYEADDQRYCSDLVLEAARAMDGLFATIACEMQVEGKPETYANEVTCAIDGNLSFILMEAADQLDADEAERKRERDPDEWRDAMQDRQMMGGRAA